MAAHAQHHHPSENSLKAAAKLVMVGSTKCHQSSKKSCLKLWFQILKNCCLGEAKEATPLDWPSDLTLLDFSLIDSRRF